MTQVNENKIIAITGASGLLGRHLCNYFRRKGWRVHALVRDVSQYPFSETGIRVFKCDLPGSIDTASFASADILIHSAYMTRFTNIEEAKRVNEGGMMNLYKAAKNVGVKKFVFISTLAASPNAQSFYAKSKYKLELGMDLSDDLVIRPGLVLAPDGGLFHRITNLVRKLPAIPAFGGGKQKLRTIYIDDLCHIFEKAIELDISGIVVAAESDGIEMKDLLRAILNGLGQKKLIVHVPVMPFVLFLQLIEALKIKFPVSSENLLGLINRDEGDMSQEANVPLAGIEIRGATESINKLFLKSG